MGTTAGPAEPADSGAARQAATLQGPALAVTTGLAAGALLLGTAAAGFRDLARLRPAHRRGRARPRQKAR